MAKAGRLPTDLVEKARAWRSHHEQAGKLEYLIHPLTYLNGERWLDESLPYEKQQQSSGQRRYNEPTNAQIEEVMKTMETEKAN